MKAIARQAYAYARHHQTNLLHRTVKTSRRLRRERWRWAA
jgi:hypothetical protein